MTGEVGDVKVRCRMAFEMKPADIAAVTAVTAPALMRYRYPLWPSPSH